jgi:ribosome biogenesis GTPase
MDRKHGVVVRFHSNMLDVIDSNTREKYMCTLRGKFKKQKIRPLVGDTVEYIGFPDMKGRIENILPRKNELARPHIANIDQVILVLTMSHPPLSLLTLDKFLILAESQEIDSILVFNKADLLTHEEREKMKEIIDYYSKFYTVLETSAKSGKGLEPLKTIFSGKLSTMAGMSGVGKSSLLNAIEPGLKLKEGLLSEQLEKGKHTTTYSELLSIGSNGFIADTPGFAFLDMKKFNKDHIKFMMPDIINHSRDCAFDDCSHINEPDCGVVDALERGELLDTRYNSYVQIYGEIENS